MTNREAIASEIEPYSLSDNAYEVAFIYAQEHFDTEGGVDDTYSASMMKTVALAAMKCLAQLYSLQNENIGGISQSYDTDNILKALKSLAKSSGLSAELVLDDTSDNYGVDSPKLW